MLRWLTIFSLLLFALPAWSEQAAVPPLTARVTDLTGTLTADQAATLESRLQTLEMQKGSQIAVLIIPSTQPETIEEYAIRVVDQWKLGRKKVDDGVLLLVAKNDRKVRLEIGYGLEGALPDAIAKRIIAEDITPHFKQGDIYGGIVAGVTRIDAIIHGENLPPPAAQSDRMGDIGNHFVLLVIVALVSGVILRSLFGMLPGALLNGGLIGLLTMLFGGGMVLALVFAVVAFFFSLINSRNDGFGAGGWGGSGGGFSSGGGGGFSGGGGGFGGGGASGDW